MLTQGLAATLANASGWYGRDGMCQVIQMASRLFWDGAVPLRLAEFLNRFGTCCSGQIRARLWLKAQALS